LGDLADVVAVVGDHLPEGGFESARYFLVAVVGGFNLAVKLGARRSREFGELGEEPGKISSQTIPFTVGCRGGWETLRIVFGIGWFFAADAAEFVAHPVIHVEDEFGDRVGEAFDMPFRQVSGGVLDAREGISVGAFTVEKFSECALGHFEFAVPSLTDWTRLLFANHVRQPPAAHMPAVTGR
jgi:hypothetical protein